MNLQPLWHKFKEATVKNKEQSNQRQGNRANPSEANRKWRGKQQYRNRNTDHVTQPCVEIKNTASPHQISRQEAITFASGFGAVRARFSPPSGGFNPALRFLEDIDFGYRLHSAGHRIWLDRTTSADALQALHVRELTPLRFFGRAGSSWAHLMLKQRTFKTSRPGTRHGAAAPQFLAAAGPLLIDSSINLQGIVRAK